MQSSQSDNRSFWFEFDPVNKILVGRLQGTLTTDVAAECYSLGRRHWAATNARACIADFSSVTSFAFSGEFVGALARQEPLMPDATRPLFLVMAADVGYGLGRMYQIVGEKAMPLVHVVRAMDEAVAAVCTKSPRFERLE